MRRLLHISLPLMLVALAHACVHPGGGSAKESSDDWYYAGCRTTADECKRDCGRNFKAQGAPEKCPEESSAGTVACYCSIN